MSKSGLAATLHVSYKGARPDVEVKLADLRVTSGFRLRIPRVL